MFKAIWGEAKVYTAHDFEWPTEWHDQENEGGGPAVSVIVSKGK
jgi:hypothetical protein